MGFKALLTHVEPLPGQQAPHLAWAMTLAAGFEAHLAALVFATEVMEVTAPGAEDDPQALEAATAHRIETDAARLGVACVILGRSSFAYGFPEVFADHAKLSDLAVLGYGPGATAARRMLAAGAIFSSGRPVLMVPSGPAPDGLPRRVAVAWNATPASVRATHGALPLILRAEEAVVLAVTDDAEFRPGQSGAELAHLLARHGARASFRPVRKGGQRVFDALMDAAAAEGADMLAMGGVAHSPLHKLVLGSATDGLLDGRARLPVLASA
jgi:nucleotide-binding universal stress UspA family protein